jgi:hypothetical protein
MDVTLGLLLTVSQRQERSTTCIAVPWRIYLVASFVIESVASFPVVSLDSVYEICTTRSCLLFPSRARDTIPLTRTPSVPVVRG